MLDNVSFTQHAVKGLSEGETRLDLHCREVPACPLCWADRPGSHYSHANRNGLWRGHVTLASMRTVECNPALTAVTAGIRGCGSKSARLGSASVPMGAGPPPLLL